MAKRTRNQAQGDLGELAVSMALVRLGVSINALTQSDTGWDLHLHVPAEPVEALAEKDPWSMSGHVVHAQVKSRSSRSWPRVRLGTARGWVASSRTGVPTFLFVVDASRRTWTTSFVTAGDIASWLSAFTGADDNKMQSIGKLPCRTFPAEGGEGAEFGRVLDVWARFPRVMLEMDRGVTDDVLAGGPVSVETVVDRAVPFVTACLTAHQILDLNDDFRRIDHLIQQFADDLVGREDQEEFGRQLLDRLTCERAPGGGWFDGMPAGAFSRWSNPDQIELDARAVLGRIASMWRSDRRLRA